MHKLSIRKAPINQAIPRTLVIEWFLPGHIRKHIKENHMQHQGSSSLQAEGNILDLEDIMRSIDAADELQSSNEKEQVHEDGQGDVIVDGQSINEKKQVPEDGQGDVICRWAVNQREETGT
jgi:hypothetical protein